MFAIVSGFIATACLLPSSHHIDVVRQLHNISNLSANAGGNSIYVRRISLTTVVHTPASMTTITGSHSGVEQYVKNHPGKLSSYQHPKVFCATLRNFNKLQHRDDPPYYKIII